MYFFGRLLFTDLARVQLANLKRESNEKKVRLPLLIETLKEVYCCGANTIEMLKNQTWQDKRVYSGRLNQRDRLHAVRTVENGQVTEIVILSILGHTN